MTKMMRRWELNAFGRENLKLVEVPIPEPSAGELLVRVAAASLNYRDGDMIRSGMAGTLVWPFTPGSDMAGTVVAAGLGATRFASGQRVISTFSPGWIDGKPPGNARTPAYQPLGGYHPGILSEYVAMPEHWFAAAPISLTDQEASTLPCAGLTAWFSLIERGRVHAGETVLVLGPAGLLCLERRLRKHMVRRSSSCPAATRNWHASRRLALLIT